MSNQERFLLAGAISAAIHAYLVIAADPWPWIDPPRLKPALEKELFQVTLTPAAELDEPPPRSEPQAATAAVAPLRDEPASGEGIASDAPPAPTVASKSPPARPAPAQPDARATRLVPDRNRAPRKARATAPKAGKPKKTPKRIAAKPTSRKQKAKRSAKGRVPKRARAKGRRPTTTGSRKSAARKSAKAGPQADSRRIRRPRPIHRPRPKYPRSARRRGLEGTVTLRVLVDTRGRVGKCRVHKSSGHRILDERAMKTVRGTWTFQPGKKGKRLSAMWVQVPIRFQLR